MTSRLPPAVRITKALTTKVTAMNSAISIAEKTLVALTVSADENEAVPDSQEDGMPGTVVALLAIGIELYGDDVISAGDDVIMTFCETI